MYFILSQTIRDILLDQVVSKSGRASKDARKERIQVLLVNQHYINQSVLQAKPFLLFMLLLHNIGSIVTLPQIKEKLLEADPRLSPSIHKRKARRVLRLA